MKQYLYFHASAEEELTAALDWYAMRSERAASHFMAEVEHAMQRLCESPSSFPSLVGPARRALLGRFPYAIVFRETPRGIEVVAVAHAKRRPGYWRTRMRE